MQFALERSLETAESSAPGIFRVPHGLRGLSQVTICTRGMLCDLSPRMNFLIGDITQDITAASFCGAAEESGFDLKR